MLAPSIHPSSLNVTATLRPAVVFLYHTFAPLRLLGTFQHSRKGKGQEKKKSILCAEIDLLDRLTCTCKRNPPTCPQTLCNSSM